MGCMCICICIIGEGTIWEISSGDTTLGFDNARTNNLPARCIFLYHFPLLNGVSPALCVSYSKPEQFLFEHMGLMIYF